MQRFAGLSFMGLGWRNSGKIKKKRVDCLRLSSKPYHSHTLRLAYFLKVLFWPNFYFPLVGSCLSNFSDAKRNFFLWTATRPLIFITSWFHDSDALGPQAHADFWDLTREVLTFGFIYYPLVRGFLVFWSLFFWIDLIGRAFYFGV